MKTPLQKALQSVPARDMRDVLDESLCELAPDEALFVLRALSMAGHVSVAKVSKAIFLTRVIKAGMNKTGMNHEPPTS